MPTIHTPGPWSLSDEDSPLLSGADGGYIAQVFSRTGCENGSLRPNYAEDARLIAAAPDLLEALQLAFRHLNGGSDSLTPMEHDRAFKLARAAIAKATTA